MGGRYALLIGSYEYYQEPALSRLKGPENDIASLSAVLAEPDIGGFLAETSVNEPSSVVARRLEGFLTEREPDDVVLLYFSGHGFKATDGELYFAMSDTSLRWHKSTSVKARYVHELLRDCSARQQLLILDCCYSGAFARGMVMRRDASVDTAGQFKQGRGLEVLTASDAIQYAFEVDNADQAIGRQTTSVFTSALVHGLLSGDADTNRDGTITIDELFPYIQKNVRRKTTHQTPRRWAFDVDGPFEIARVPEHRQKAALLPRDVLTQLDEHQPLWARKAAVFQLEKLLLGTHVGEAKGALERLDLLVKHDDSKSVVALAQAILARNRNEGESPSISESDSRKQWLPSLDEARIGPAALQTGSRIKRAEEPRARWLREAAVQELVGMLADVSEGEAVAAKKELERYMQEDDSKAVSAAAANALAKAALPKNFAEDSASGPPAPARDSQTHETPIAEPTDAFRKRDSIAVSAADESEHIGIRNVEHQFIAPAATRHASSASEPAPTNAIAADAISTLTTTEELKARASDPGSDAPPTAEKLDEATTNNESFEYPLFSQEDGDDRASGRHDTENVDVATCDLTQLAPPVDPAKALVVSEGERTLPSFGQAGPLSNITMLATLFIVMSLAEVWLYEQQTSYIVALLKTGTGLFTTICYFAALTTIASPVFAIAVAGEVFKDGLQVREVPLLCAMVANVLLIIRFFWCCGRASLGRARIRSS